LGDVLIKLGNSEYKIYYLDTNILRATLEMSQNIHENTLLKLNEKAIFAISVLTLVEISHRRELIEKFITFINAIPMLILKPSNQILDDEKKYFNQDLRIENLILLISNPLDPNTTDEVVSFLRSENFYDISHKLKNDQTDAFLRIQKEIEAEKDVSCKAEEFVKKRLLITIGNDYFFSLGDRNFLSQKIINLLLFYTYKERRKKAERSAPFDFLISSIVPYVDTFITENSQAKSFNTIKKKHNIIDNVEILVMKDLR
jgi:hypothetical protein